ncbi:OstA-like protein [Lutibacter sp.]|uniref:OstA-like protein n=1 Tax=Lutibacter sp. TaxID=1925666 RepID=UPI003563335C
MKKLLFVIIIFISFTGISQTKKIKILKADNTFTDPKFPDATISMGNVFIEHEGATLRCDKAYIYQEKKLVKAMGNVVINQGDTIVQTSKYTDYDAQSKIATSWGNVVLKDDVMTLSTDTLKFDRENQQLFYKSGGIITDVTNVLKSRIGDYYLRTKKFQALTNVEVTSKDSKVVSNHLDYYTNTGIADLMGPSTITSKENSIYTEKGHHNSKTNISHFLKNSKIFYNDRTIEGDSLYYNKNIEFASATGNIIVVDTVNNSIIKGGYAEYFKLKDSVFITKKAVAISIIEKDSVFIHGDKLMVTGKIEDRIVRAFNRVKIFKSDLQGKCDSLITFEKTGLTKLIRNPVMWTQGNQITGDTIHLISNPKTEQLDSLKILDNAFMVQKDSAGFSQLKGKNMFGKFKDNALKSLDVVGNSEVVFYIRNDLQELVGITRMKSSKNIFITMENNEIETIDFIEKPEGKTYPPSKLPEKEKILKGFIWREKERPLNNDGIFIYDELETKEKEITKN